MALKEEDVMLKLQQRVTQLESQLAESIRQHNQEAGDLQNTAVRLRAQLEQGETNQQRLQYQLILAQKDARDLLEEKEKEWMTLRTSLKGHISKLTQQCQEWSSTLETVQKARARDRLEHEQVLHAKNTEFLHKTTLLEHEHHNLTADLTSARNSLTELKSILCCSEDELSVKNEEVSKLKCQLKDANSRENKLKKHFQDATDKTKVLEDCLKSALSFAQQDADMYKDKNHELESLLGTERQSYMLVVTQLQETKGIVNGFQSSLEREEKKCSLISKQLKSKENDCESLRQQKREDQTVISNLSYQLQLHKDSIRTLNQQLDLIIKKLALTKKTTNSSLKEVLSLIDVFWSQHSFSQAVDESNQISDHIDLKEKLRELLNGLCSQLTDAQSRENVNTKLRTERVEQLTHECKTYREIVNASTSAMNDAELKMSDNSKELSRLNFELTESQSVLSTLQKQLNTLTQRKEESESRCNEFVEELSTLKRKHSIEYNAHCKYLSSLFGHLSPSISTRVFPSENNSTSSLPESVMSSLSMQWDTLATTVTTSVEALSEALKQTKRELKQVKSTNHNLNAMLESVNVLHEESTQKLTTNTKEREKQWVQRTDELKTHYDTKLVEMERRCLELEQHASELTNKAENVSLDRERCVKYYESQIQELNQAIKVKTNSISSLYLKSEESTNREKVLSELNKELETQISQLQEVHRGYKNDRACLLACTCLLLGSLFPALQRVQDLTVQRAHLLKQVSACSSLHVYMGNLVKSIQTDLGKADEMPESSPSLFSMHPLLHFRKVVIVVLATNRLFKLVKRSKFLFSVFLDLPLRNYYLKTGHQHLSVYIGQRYTRSKKQNESNEEQSHHQRYHTNDIATWLRSEKMLVDIRDCFSDLQSTLDSCTSHQSKQTTTGSYSSLSHHQTSSNKMFAQDVVVINPARDCYTRLLQKMSLRFQEDTASSYTQPSSALKLEGSLIFKLGKGLEHALQRLPSLHHYAGCSELGGLLNTQLTNLIDRLHKVEVERHSLLLQLDQVKYERDQLSNASQDALKLESEVEKLRNELTVMVSHDTYITVCSDLEGALKREHELKVSLSKHSISVKQFRERLQQDQKNLLAKNSALSATEKEVNEFKLNIQHKEQLLQDLTKQLQQANNDRMRLAQQVGDLQSSLTICRKQISIAHATVAAESMKPSLTYGPTESD